MKRLARLGALVPLVLALSAAPALAQMSFDISCQGTESMGGGLNRYEYSVRNNTPVVQMLAVFCFGTEDPILANYVGVVAPPGWVLAIVPNGGGPCPAGFTTAMKTPHGLLPPAGGPASTFQCVFSGPAVPLPPGASALFGFQNYHCSWDVEWFATGTAFGQGFVNLPIAGPIGVYTNGWIHAPSPIPPPPRFFCDATDNSLVACPCNNPGLPNTGCDNAQATGGVGINVQSWSPDCMGGGTAVLVGTGFPPATTPSVVVIRAPNLDPATPVVFGDGLRCVGVPLVRIAAGFAAGGVSVHAINHGAGPGLFHYQLWYRNTPAPFCTPAAFNLSNGVALLWP